MIDVYCVKVGDKYDRSFVEKLKDLLKDGDSIDELKAKIEKLYSNAEKN